jgi:two-component system invasion response regulator UvrY
MIRVMLVDDHVLFRRALISMLQEAGDVHVVADLSTGEKAVEYVNTYPVDLVLMDINMAGMGGIEATRRILRIAPTVKVIAVTAMGGSPYPDKLLEIGVHGYLSKECRPQEFFEAIRTVMVGNSYISDDVARKVAANCLGKKEAGTMLKGLSLREMQIMTMIVNGHNNQDIYNQLNLSPKTISTYRHRLYEKLGVANDVELTHFALRHDILC